jgi:hypothetical protein
MPNQREIVLLCILYRNSSGKKSKNLGEIQAEIPKDMRKDAKAILQGLETKYLVKEVKSKGWFLTNEGSNVAATLEKYGQCEISPPTGKTLFEFQLGELWNGSFRILSVTKLNEEDAIPGYVIQEIVFSFRCPHCRMQSRSPKIKNGAKYYATETDMHCNTCKMRVYTIRNGSLVITRRFFD